MSEHVESFLNQLYGSNSVTALNQSQKDPNDNFAIDTSKRTQDEPKANEVTLPKKMRWTAPVRRAGGKWQTIVEIALLVALFPTLIYGSMALGVRYALAMSLIVIACAVVLFLFLFETRKPHPREVVIIATLVALAVAARSMFFMLPQFKPVAAIVIIAGVSLGQETGFIVGALTMVVSNIFFGQGPWTPWQMLAFGLIGFVAGLLHRVHILPATRTGLCIFGFLSIFFIYGLIMNPASLLMFSSTITPLALVAVYISGAPMDFVHAFSTVIFLLILAKPFLEKLERLKVKYGLR